jgi:hypothetical protein
MARRHLEKIGSQRLDLPIEAEPAPCEPKPIDQHVGNGAFADHAQTETCIVFLAAPRLSHERHDSLSSIRPFRGKPLLEQILQFVR